MDNHNKRWFRIAALVWKILAIAAVGTVVVGSIRGDKTMLVKGLWAIPVNLAGLYLFAGFIVILSGCVNTSDSQ